MNKPERERRFLEFLGRPSRHLAEALMRDEARERKLVVSLLRGHRVGDKRQRALLDHLAGLIERGLHLPENHETERTDELSS